MEKLNRLGPGIFLDLKFHDIPNTVEGAVTSALHIPGVQFLDVHALGGLEMMRVAAKARDEAAARGSAVPKLLAITILTSMDNKALRGVGIGGPASKRVVQLARMAQEAGMDGVVASPQEVRAIRRACGKSARPFQSDECLDWSAEFQINFCNRVREIVPAARATRPEFPVMLDKF